jgi:hypothetical protein
MDYVGPPPARPERPARRPTNHILHLLLSIVTAGFWLIIWAIAAQQTAGINHQAERGVRRLATAVRDGLSYASPATCVAQPEQPTGSRQLGGADCDRGRRQGFLAGSAEQ